MKLSRRAALRTALFLATPWVIGVQQRLNAKNTTNESSNKKSILVIGAGIAGITAARHLQNNGHQVTVLEGRDRLGGRIHTKKFGNTSIDLGAAWIHGDSPDNPLITLAKRYRLNTSPTNWDETWFYQEHEGVIEDEDFERIEAKADQLVSSIHRLQENAQNNESIEATVDRLLNSLDEPEHIKRGVRWWLSSEIEGVSGTNYKNLSLRYWDEDEAFDGDDLLIAEGYGALVERMAEGLNIQLNHTVQTITHTNLGIKAAGSWGSIEADQAILSVPLGVLKAQSIQFSPPLPADKIASINRLSMGLLNKIILTFKKPFWPSDAHRLGLLTDSTKERIEYFPVPPGGNSGILVGLAYGDFAREIERMSKNEVINKAIGQLQKMVPTISVDDVIDVYITRWASDPMAQGAYIHIPPNGAMGDCENLSRSISDRLFFAGEATNQIYFGTVHGAYLSGMRAAQEI